MHGYLRRKVTYNLGRGGNSAPAPRHKGSHGPIHLGGGILGLFTDHNSGRDLPEHHVIIDEAGSWNVGKEYADMGLSEGWLEYGGYSRDTNDELVHRYRMV